MTESSNDQSVLQRIGRLVEEEHALHAHGATTDQERRRLGELKIELDQCWDLLRQRRALRAIVQSQVRADDSAGSKRRHMRRARSNVSAARSSASDGSRVSTST